MLSYPCEYGSQLRPFHDDIFLRWFTRPGRGERYSKKAARSNGGSGGADAAPHYSTEA